MMPIAMGELLDNGDVSILVNDTFNLTVTAEFYKRLILSQLYEMKTSQIVLLVLYSLVFLLAAISNILVIVVICRFQHLRRFETWTLYKYF